MSRFNTGNPLDSNDPRDLDDNAKNLDQAVNSEDSQWIDRFGRPRLPLMEQERQFVDAQDRREGEFQTDQSSREGEFQSAQASREAVFSDFLQASGYQDLGEYAPGIEITAHNQYVTFGGQPYLLKPSIPVPYTTSGEWTGDDFKLIGDDALRQDLANPDKGAAMVAYLTPAQGAVQRSVGDRLDDTVSLRDFGPILDSDAFQRATDFVFSKGGGTILIPAGEYTLEGVVMREGVYYQGESQRGCVLSLPDNPTQSMFIAEPAERFDFGGFSNLQLKGGQHRDSATADGIDFSAVDSILTFHIDGCYIEGFRRGFNGSLGTGVGNDRFCIIRHTSFWHNDVGLFTNEHAFLHSCEFRANNVGLDGRINDFFALNTRFVGNRYGVNRDGVLTNAQFFACSLWKNTEWGARLGGRSSWVGGRVAGENRADSNDGYGDVGIFVSGDTTRISNVIFGQVDESTSFGGSCILIDRTAGPVTRNHDISNNTFNLYGAGVGVESIEDGGSGLNSSSISNNVVRTSGRPFFKAFRVSMCQISGNNVEIFEDLPAGVGVFDIQSGTPNQFCNNVVGSAPTSAGAMATGHALTGDVAGGVIISDNTFRNFDAGPVSVTNGNRAKWSNNLGYKTENHGEALIEEGATQVIVPHGLDRQPTPSDFYITATNEAAAVSGAYVAGATASNLIIRLTSPAPEGGCSFAWRASITSIYY